VKRIGLILHAENPEAAETGRWLARALGERGVEVQAPVADVERLGAGAVTAVEAFADDLDLVVALGGDGTLLRAVAAIQHPGPPLLGVNFGHLGFLSQMERSELAGGLATVLDGAFDIDERMMLEARLDGGEQFPALNEVIVEKSSVGRAIRLSVAIGGEPVASWLADGLIVATPTGSTAYSFSAGGPVVAPAVPCLVVTPVAPHGVFNRTLVVPPGEEVLVRVLPGSDAASLSADGRAAVDVPPGSDVRVRAALAPVRLARVDGSPFWKLVREKFRLYVEDA